MLRTPTSSLLRSAAVVRAAASPSIACRAASTHAISNPTLANIEKRWEGLPLQEQAELWMALRDRMKENWSELTIQEKKAGESAHPRPIAAPDACPGVRRRMKWPETASAELRGLMYPALRAQLIARQLFRACPMDGSRPSEVIVLNYQTLALIEC